MKKILALLLGTLLVGSALAQQPSLQATFYDGIPSKTGALITDDFGQTIAVNLVSNTIGKKIYDIDEASYIALQVGNDTLVFKIFGGDTTNEMTLSVNSDAPNTEDHTTMNLGQVVAMLENETTPLAVFRDDDGVVRGFYSYEAANLPTVAVDDAETLTLLHGTSTETLQIADPGTVKLESVMVLQGSDYVPLEHTLAFEKVMDTAL